MVNCLAQCNKKKQQPEMGPHFIEHILQRRSIQTTSFLAQVLEFPAKIVMHLMEWKFYVAYQIPCIAYWHIQESSFLSVWHELLVQIILCRFNVWQRLLSRYRQTFWIRDFFLNLLCSLLTGKKFWKECQTFFRLRLTTILCVVHIHINSISIWIVRICLVNR